MNTISLDSNRILEWNWWNNYGEINLSDETINYNDLQIDCDVKATCKLFKEAGDFHTPGSSEIQNLEVEVSNIKVFDEDGEPVRVTTEHMKVIASDIKNYIKSKL